MSFDKATRNALARMVGHARERLAADVTDRLLRLGFQADGTVLELGRIDGLTEEERSAGEELRQLLGHRVAAENGAEAARRQSGYRRMVREIGFTTFNRLVALRMAEERDLIVQSVGSGFSSAGFRVFNQVAKGALGGRLETYRAYLEGLYDEIALDLPALFDRSSPESFYFPGEQALQGVLGLLNDPALAHLWKEDEAIGWVYQYYNDPDERKKMREASSVPRNSRELAVRNQFFTPRYVVEFLTDNTLGRTWYEMRKGGTALAERCRYMVRRPQAIFLKAGEAVPEPWPKSNWGVEALDPDSPGEMWVQPDPEQEDIDYIFRYALTLGGYQYAKERWGVECADLANGKAEEQAETGQWNGTFEELRCCLFFEQRRWHHFGDSPEGDALATIQALYKAVCDRWDREAEAIPHRGKNDPRKIRVLDPACGSGHFLLYAYDLLETIYEEAYEDAELRAELRRDYPDPEGYRRALPGLILRHNLHGIDIDPRAIQIAGLALWLRAQRAYQAMGLGAAERPPIRKSNIVCAEPMPGEKEMLEEYLRELDPRLRPLVRTVWEKMQLAGEAGSLLKIEEDIQQELGRYRQDALVGPARQAALFKEYEKPQQLGLTVADDSAHVAFWYEAEEALLRALRDFSERATNGSGTRRRMFKDDAEQGFAFIDLCRNRFDVVLMNPPFGDPGTRVGDLLPPKSGRNLYAAFVLNALRMCRAFIGAITDRTFLVQSTFADYRECLTRHDGALELAADLGWEVLDSADVQVVAYTVRVGRTLAHRFTDVRKSDDKEASLRTAIMDVGHWTSLRDSQLQTLPGSAFAYDLPRVLLDLVRTGKRLSDLAFLPRGLGSNKATRTYRAWYEVPGGSIGEQGKYRSLSNGGEFSPFYREDPGVADWVREDGALLVLEGYSDGFPAYDQKNCAHYFSPGLSFPKQSMVFNVAVLPDDVIPTREGKAIVPHQANDIWPLVGYLNSSLVRRFVDAVSGLHKQSGTVGRIPIPAFSPSTWEALGKIARDAAETRYRVLMGDESSRLFVAPYLGHEPSEGSVKAWGTEQAYRAVDAAIAEALHLDAYDRSEIERTIHQVSMLFAASQRDLVSYAVGCAFGRWDVRMMQEPSLAPRLPGPADSLPCCAPGTLVDPIGYPASRSRIVSVGWLRARRDANSLPPVDFAGHSVIADSDYPIRISWDGILVYDPENEDDIVRRGQEVFAAVWQDRAEAVEQEICSSAGVRDLREYFASPGNFFADHLKRYSKSRRQAPIYWPLSTASGSFTLWVYYHRLTSDTLYTAVNKYVDPKIAQTRRGLSELEARLAASAGREATSVRAEIETTKAFLSELEEFRRELMRVAALPYKPDLNDGVIINAAPLHKLFRLPKWAKDTKECWEKLQRGEYDWAHITHNIWPERVREKCRSDRSLAIAHGLEDLYIAPPSSAKKCKRKVAAAIEEEDEA